VRFSAAVVGLVAWGASVMLRLFGLLCVGVFFPVWAILCVVLLVVELAVIGFCALSRRYE